MPTAARSRFLLIVIATVFAAANLCSSKIIYPKLNIVRNPASKLGLSQQVSLFRLSFQTDGKEIVLILRKGKSPFQDNFFIRKQLGKLGDASKLLEINQRDIGDHIYEDVERKSSLLVYPMNGEGVLLYGLVRGVMMVWPTINSKFLSKHHKTIPHYLKDVSITKTITFDHSANVTLGGDLVGDHLNLKPVLTEIPEALHIEVVVMVTSDYQSKFRTVDDFAKYLALFFQYINIMFSDLEKPRVSMSLVGAYLDTDKALSRYFRNYSFEEIDGNLAEDIKLIMNINPFLKDTKLDRNFDAGIILTGWDLAFRNKTDPEIIQEGSIGIASLGGVCNNSRNVVFVEDIALEFSGIYTAIHEIGHLLGLSHDVDSRTLDGKACTVDGEYIMSPTVSHKISKNPRFSSCSVEKLQSFSQSMHAKCLLDTPMKRKFQRF